MRDIWLTGFDAPCLHTMYADKPMQGHGLMLEKHGIACDVLHGSDWKKAVGDGKKTLFALPALQEHILEQEDGKTRWNQVITELSRALMNASAFTLRAACRQSVSLRSAALCAASDEATEIRDDVALFQAIQAALNKKDSGNRKTPEQIDAAVRQLVSKAITTDGQVIDVFTAAGLPKPDISILSDGFLAEVRGLKHKNVAAELLEKLLKDELKVRSKRNLVQSQLFSDKLTKTLNAYHNHAISTMEVIEQLIRLAKDLDAATKRGEDLGLTDDEIALTPSLPLSRATPSALRCLFRSPPSGSALRRPRRQRVRRAGHGRRQAEGHRRRVDHDGAQERDDRLDAARGCEGKDWLPRCRHSVGLRPVLCTACLSRPAPSARVMVKRILNKYGYPPDLQEEAVKTVLQQAELLCADWV